MGIKKYSVLILVLAFLMGVSVIPRFAKLTIKVIDEDGIPVKDADVTISFSNPKPDGKGWGSTATKKKGKSDANGFFSASGQHNDARVDGFAEKEGYYSSGDGFDVESLKGTNWQPWNPTIKLVLKKKRNPVPMYAKSPDPMKIPVFEEPIGYDLEVGDWVVPYGKGKTQDFIFTFKSHVVAWNDYECSYTLEFSNPNDGIQEYYPEKGNQSTYRWPYEAPLDNYNNKLTKFAARTLGQPEKTNIKQDREIQYIFRVRSKTDDSGNIINANYGKIKGEISIGWDNYVSLSSYYLNPNEKSRSLEFNTEKNLFIPEGSKKRRRENFQFPQSD